ncbi:MAG TPA: hypothetical protein VK427_22035, partial [Kofleriaceae bacterium]|nr:hypothetical protein [Kofleriaceae bacterium]
MRMGLVLAVLLGACGGGGTMSGDAGDTRQVVATVRATANRDIDILFVIDDSRSMAGRQAKLAASIGGLGRLVDAQGRLPNLHIGVITTDMGTTGSGVGAPGPQVGTIGEGGCALAGKDGVLQMKTPGVTGNFLRDIAQPNGTRMRNYTGNLEAVLGDMVTTGGIGCAFEQPLHAMKRALTPRPTNAGFLRPTAALGIFFLTDEDDCSARDPELFAPSEAKLGPVDSFRCTRYGVFCAQGGTTPDEMMQVGTKGSCMPSTTSTLLDDVATYRDFLLSLKPDPSQITLGG